jgi:hypothetical protein
MTNTAYKVWEAFWKNTEYPEDIDGWNLANALRAIANEFQYYHLGPGEDMVIDARVLYELADELEEL